MTGVERTVRLYRLLADLAAAHERLPKCSLLADAMECKRCQIGDALALLIACGMVVIHHRICLIVATGERTA